MNPDDLKLSKKEKDGLYQLGIKKANTKTVALKLILKKLKYFKKKWDNSDFLELEYILTYHERSALTFAEGIPTNIDESKKQAYGVFYFSAILDKALMLKGLLVKSLEILEEDQKDIDMAELGMTGNKLLDFFKYRAINFKNILNYNPSLFDSIEEIVLFEYMLYKGLYFRKIGHKSFYHSKEQFFENIKIKEHKLDKSLKKFQELGYIQLQLRKMPRRTYYKLNLKKIISDMSIIHNSYGKSSNM